MKKTFMMTALVLVEIGKRKCCRRPDHWLPFWKLPYHPPPEDHHNIHHRNHRRQRRMSLVAVVAVVSSGPWDEDWFHHERKGLQNSQQWTNQKQGSCFACFLSIYNAVASWNWWLGIGTWVGWMDWSRGRDNESDGWTTTTKEREREREGAKRKNASPSPLTIEKIENSFRNKMRMTTPEIGSLDPKKIKTCKPVPVVSYRYAYQQTSHS